MRAIIVDDDADRFEMLADILEKHGFKSIAWCSTPFQAWGTIRTEKADLILLDHDLKSTLTGQDVAYGFYESVNKKTPVLVTSCNPVGAKAIMAILKSMNIPSIETPVTDVAKLQNGLGGLFG